MTMSEVEVDRITQQVFAARNSGLDAALVKVVIDEIEKATEAQAAKIARVEKLAREWEADRDVCLAWIADPTMHADEGHPMRLSGMADILNQHASNVRTALGGES